ncbi:MAG: glycosyltransferase, partial [Planctomycetota bacterium]
NASRDESAGVVRRLAPAAALFQMPHNVGYGAALNRAVRECTEPWIVCANPDVDFSTLDPAALIAAIEGAGTADGVLAPTVLDADGGVALSTGPDPAIGRLLLGLFRPRRLRHYYGRAPAAGSAVDWATGACLVVRRSAWTTVDGFDGEYFLYYDDADFCRRLREAGLRIRYRPELRVVHQAPYHDRPRSARLSRIIMESRRRYFRQHRPAWEQGLLGLLEPVERLLRRPADRETSGGTPAGAMNDSAARR